MEKDCFPPKDLFKDPKEGWEGSVAFWVRNVLADDEDKTVGYFGLTPHSDVVDSEDADDRAPGCLYVMSIGIHPDWRRHGFGRETMNLIVEYARRNQFTRVVLVVRSSNIAARKMFRRSGFSLNRKVEEFFDNGDGTWETGVVMDMPVE